MLIFLFLFLYRITETYGGYLHLPRLENKNAEMAKLNSQLKEKEKIIGENTNELNSESNNETTNEPNSELNNETPNESNTELSNENKPSSKQSLNIEFSFPSSTIGLDEWIIGFSTWIISSSTICGE